MATRTKTAIPHYVKVAIHHDGSPEDPLDNDGQWSLVQFRSGYNRYEDPEKYRLLHAAYFSGETRETIKQKAEAKKAAWEAENEGYDYQYDDEDEINNDEDMLKLLDSLHDGYAYWLDYFEHGNCSWSRSGHGQQCQWDNSRHAGILYWEHPREDIGNIDAPPEERLEQLAKDADGFLECYTDWCNGWVYGYSIDDAITDEHIGSCYGFFGSDEKYMMEQLKEELPEHAVIVKFKSNHGHDADDVAGVPCDEDAEYPTDDTHKLLVPDPGFLRSTKIKSLSLKNLRAAVARAREVVGKKPRKKLSDNPSALIAELAAIASRKINRRHYTALPRVVGIDD